MVNQKQIDRTEIVSLVISILQNMLSKKNKAPLGSIGESTYLIGSRSMLDSLSLVNLVVDLEQKLEEKYGITLVLADEHEMIRKNSPFQTAGSLADHICLKVEEKQR